MKNKLFKKSMSVFLSVLMILSCWVWTPGIAEHNHASAVASNVRGVPAIKSSHYAGTTAAYGTPVFDGNLDRWFKFHNKGNDYVQINYPSNIYLDKSETLQSAGYFFNVDWQFGGSSDYRILIGAPALGDNSAYSGYPDKYYTMTNCFSNYGFDSSVPSGGAKKVYNTSTGGTDYDLRIVGYGHSTQGSDGFNYDGTRHDKYVLYRSYSPNPNTATIYLMGTPNGTYDKKEYNTTGASLGSYGFQQNYTSRNGWQENNNSMFKQKSYDAANDGCSSYYEGQYAEMQWFVTVYDKSALNSVIKNANNLLTQKGKYTTASLDNLQTVLNANKGVLTTRATTQNNINTAKNKIQEAIDNLVEYGVAFDNLFNFNEFTIGGNLTVNERTDKGFTVTSTAEDGNTGFSHAIPVIPGKTYVLSADVGITAVSGGYDMYIHTLDANKAGETTAVPDTSNGAHREGDVYISLTGQTSNKTPYIRFTAGNNTKFIKIRFDANTPGNKLTVNNIRLLNETDFEGVSYVPTKMYKNKALLGSAFDVPTRPGYTFNCWYVDNSGNEQYDASEEVTDGNGNIVSSLLTYEIAQNWILYSDWTEHKYNISFDANGGLGSTAGINNVLYTAEKTLTSNAFTRTGYTFAGWNTDENGNGTAYADGATVSKLSATNGATVTLYAQWTVNKHTITFKKVDGTTSSAQYDYGTPASSITKPKNTAAGYDVNEHFNYGWPTITDVTKDATYEEVKTSQSHTYTETITKQPSCKEEGIKTFSCSCGYSYTETMAKVAHTPGAEATCTAPQTCTVCGTELKAANGHTPAAAVSENVKDASCTADGSYDEVVYCSVCSIEISRTPKKIDKLDHTEATREENRKEATCGADGSYDLVTYCSVCNAVIKTESTTIPATGEHTLGEYIIDKDATCVTPGSKHRECANCDYETEAEAIPATGNHVYGDWAQFNNGTTHRRTCTADSNCTAFEEDDHVFNGTVKKLEGENYHQYKCDKCEAYGTSAGMNAKEACFGEGTTFTQIADNASQHKETCKCGREKNDGHTYGNWYADPENKNDKKGKMSRECSECKFVETTTCNYEKTSAYKAPTCTENGYQGWECKDAECTNGYTEILPATGHTWDEGVITTPATCSAEGVKTFTCKNDTAHTKTEAVEIDADAHNWSEWTETVAPTCTTEGQAKRTCKYNEAHVETKELDTVADAHIYGEWIDEVPATCITEGTKGHYKCSECNKYFDTDNNEIKDLTITKNDNHVNTTDEAQQNPTCTKIGYTAGKYCNDCKTWISGHEEIPAIAHKNKVHHEKVDATCVAEGTIEYWSCPDCDKNFVDKECTEAVTDLTIDIDENNHDLENHEAKAPTCTEIGWDAYVTCKREGCTHSTYEEIEANGHSYKSVTTDPTCFAKGYTTYTCSECKHSYVDNYVDALDHDWSTPEYTWSSDYTLCTAERRCERNCGTTAELNAKVTYEVTTPATCAEKGYTTYTADFGNTDWNGIATQSKIIQNVPVNENNHTKLNKTDAVAATCTDDGNIEYWTCEGCNKLYSDKDATTQITAEETILSATGHDYDGVVTTDPTCTDKGVKTFTCKNDASHTYTEEVAALNHIDEDNNGYCDRETCKELICDHKDQDIKITDQKEAKCLEDGYTGDERCAKCNVIITAGTKIDRLGHKDENTDHKCDNGCDIYQGTHTDTDKNHTCDYGCAETIGTCEDSDKDHDCDYGCNKVYGEHIDADENHICDYGCSVAIGACEDGDKDHDCDYGCDKVYGEHIDADKNHTCDYGCSVAIGTCEDADKDHDCDYGCDKVYGEHEDVDKNHTCDYGCTEKIGTCEDDDKDHDCDYGCDKIYGEHEDVDKNHTCDYGCTEKIGTCEDDDKDHDCDYGCDKVYGEHVDENKDHTCDYGCTESIGEHTDSAEDKDHVCDYGCGAVLEECVDKTGDKNHECDICGNDKITEHVYANADCLKPATCSECGVTTGDALGHSFTNYVSNNDATCTENGTKTAKCDRCDATNTLTDEGSALDHDWDKWETVTSATCLNAGEEKRTCKREGCNAFETNALEQKSHSYTGEYKWNNSADPKTHSQKCVNGCNEYGNETKCTFNEVVTAPTCFANGYTTYTCTVCNNSYQANYTTRKHIYVYAVGDGTQHNVTCQYNDCDYEATENCSGGIATCADKAVCEKCNTAWGEKDADKHTNLVKTEARSNTCETAGNIEYWTCEGCGKIYSDEAATDEITVAETILPAINHKEKVHHEKVEATCVATGTIEYWSCPDCKKNFSDEACTTVVTDLTIGIDSANHIDTTEHNEIPATCTTVGYTAGVFCEDCDKWISGHEEIEATNHAWTVTYEWSDDNTTCTATRACGNDESHNETETVDVTSEVTTSATCEGKGKTTYTADFKSDWAEDQTKTLENIDAINHAWTVTYKWSDDNTTCTATRTCGNDESHNETETVDVTSEVTTSATCEGKGKTTYTADFKSDWAEDQTKTLENIDAINHAWTVTYKWSDDNTTCTATRACGNDENHNETETVNVASEVTTPATCEGKGKTTYTATFTESWAEEQTKDVQDIPVAPHTPEAAVTENNVDPTCTAKGSYDSVVYCSVCDAELDRETITVDELGHIEETIPAVAPTCEATGLTAGVKCSVCNEVLAAQKTVAALGHNYEGVVTTAPTCTDKGVKTFTCKNDASHRYTEEIPALGHTDENNDGTCDRCDDFMCELIGHDYRYNRIEASCENPGYVETTCSRCSYNHKEIIPVDEDGHNWSEWEEIADSATCTTGTLSQRICSRCHKIEQKETGKAPGHIFIVEPGRDATCAYPGYTDFTYCIVCNEKTESEVIESPAHEDHDGDGKCDSCKGVMKGNSACVCICHKEGKFIRFIYKILRFIWKLLKIEKNCACSIEHY